MHWCIQPICYVSCAHAKMYFVVLSSYTSHITFCQRSASLYLSYLRAHATLIESLAAAPAREKAWGIVFAIHCPCNSCPHSSPKSPLFFLNPLFPKLLRLTKISWVFVWNNQSGGSVVKALCLPPYLFLCYANTINSRGA
jgi:hypothetical protein